MVTSNSKSAKVTAAAQAAAQAADEAVMALEGASQPVAPVAGGNGRRSENANGDQITIERERLSSIMNGLRQSYFEQFGEYPSDIGLNDELAKRLMSGLFGINLMRLGAMRAEATGQPREACYLSILRDCGVDASPFVIRSITGEERFNWRYHRKLSMEDGLEIQSKILAVYSQDLRKDKHQ